MTIAVFLLQNALIVAVCFAVLWLIALRIRDVSFVDAWWALGMVVLAWSSFFGTGAPSPRCSVKPSPGTSIWPSDATNR